MRFQNTAILALGSNTGNRLETLQWCINHIHNHVATVVQVSGIYENPSVGFDGEDFYNCCLVVHTPKNADELLDGLQQAEQAGGRVRNPNERYHSRTIDIDIIAFNNNIINDDHLQVPHPRMHERNFVLVPMRDVAPDWVHPILKQDISTLLEKSGDTSPCEFVMQLEAPISKHDIRRYGYIAIEGNIGAGKTSLAGRLAEDFSGGIVLERFAENPFLANFYADPQRYAFPLEMSFLADRYQQLSDDLQAEDARSSFIVADYHIFKSLIFSKVTLSDDEFALYKKMFDIMYAEMRHPGLYVYLKQDTQKLLEQIKARGRSYEQEITADYLESINKSYLDYIKTQTGLNVLVLDVTERDFVHRQEDYVWVLGEISNKI